LGRLECCGHIRILPLQKKNSSFCIHLFRRVIEILNWS
jgi:hypothetical protein